LIWESRQARAGQNKGMPMFMLPAYDPTAMAMLGFGILAVLGLPFIF
jgi:hypothetical protein